MGETLFNQKNINFDFRCLVLSNIYGKFINKNFSKSIITSLIHKIYQSKKYNKNTIINASAKTKRNFLHVLDLIEAIKLISNLSKKRYIEVVGKDNPFINVSSLEEVSIEKASKIISNQFRYKGKIIFKSNDSVIRKKILSHKIYDLNWRPSISFEDGVKSMIEQYKNLNK